MALEANALCTVAQVKSYMNIPESDTSYDSLFELLINSASDEIETYVGTNIINVEHTDKYDGSGGHVLIPDHFPIVSVTTFQVDNEDVGTEDDDYYIYDSYIYSEEVLTEGHKNVYLVYTAGWGTDMDNVPGTFKLACMKLVNYWHRRDVAAFSDTFGEPEAISGGGGLPAWPMPRAVSSMLDPYAKVNI